MVSSTATEQPEITLLLAISPNSIRVEWYFVEPVGTNSSIQYIIQYRNSASSTSTFQNITVAPSSQLTYTITNLMAGAQYGVRICANVSGSIGSASEELTVQTPLEGRLTAITHELKSMYV